jgi:hypothetical protein
MCRQLEHLERMRSLMATVVKTVVKTAVKKVVKTVLIRASSDALGRF